MRQFQFDPITAYREPDEDWLDAEYFEASFEAPAHLSEAAKAAAYSHNNDEPIEEDLPW